MPTFIDESGDTGPAGHGGTPYFRLAAVWVPTLDQAETFREAIRQLRRVRGLPSNYEFKFSTTHAHPERRREFLSIALGREFRFTVCSIDKTADHWNSVSGSELQWASATTLAVQLRPMYHSAEAAFGTPLREPIIVDDNSDRAFLKTVKRAFRGLRSRQDPGSSLVGPVTFRDSGPEEMLQLADMICGAVGSHLQRDDSTWYKLVAERDLRTFCLP